MKITTTRFPDEISKKLTELAINEAILEEKKRISNSEMLRRLINKAYKKLKK